MSMFRFAEPLFETGFVSGAMRYIDRYADDADSRIVLAVSINGFEATEMVLDTGSPWCIVSPLVADEMELEVTPLRDYRWSVRGVSYAVGSAIAPVEIEAEEGTNLAVEASFLVPILPAGYTYNAPNFLGLRSFLDRMRYAIDPLQNAFYFGPPD